ncbi:MAG: NINE protein [Myxococcota bacterium]
MKDKNTAGILALLLGGIGAHRFYLEQIGLGFVYLLFCWTFIPGIVAFIEGILFLTMSKEAFDQRHNAAALMWASSRRQDPQNIVVNVNAQAGGDVERRQSGVSQPAASNQDEDVFARIKQLHDLMVAGALSETEFNAEKQRLLAGQTGRLDHRA